ncbi:Methyltransferase-like protein 22 [Plecturocebus cupreus]
MSNLTKMLVDDALVTLFRDQILTLHIGLKSLARFSQEESSENIGPGVREDLTVWRGALLLADYILFRQDLFRGCTALELGAGTGLASIIAATVARTVYCTDVGADLLAMCQRNIALNSHLAAAGGEAHRVFCQGGRFLCLADGTDTQDYDIGRQGSTCVPCTR